MASPVAVPQGSTLVVNVFDGTRQPVPPQTQVLYTIRDGNQRQIFRDYRPGASVAFRELPYYNNFGDRYTVLAYADGYEQAGFTPVLLAPNMPQQVDLMLLRRNGSFNFREARWEKLKVERPALARVLTGSLADAPAGDRYRDLMENRPPALACLLNITTAMEQVHLPSGTPLDYFQELIWDETMAQDRFFGWADVRLVDQVRAAAQQGQFAPEPGTSLFHPGATSSFKQIQFGEANVQITFHEDDRRNIGGIDCVKVEPDVDYYKDLGAHALLEVLKNTVTGGLTDPRAVYVLRWIAGRRAGIPEFDPLYVIA